jgi:hypothetical protein
MTIPSVKFSFQGLSTTQFRDVWYADSPPLYDVHLLPEKLVNLTVESWRLGSLVMMNTASDLDYIERREVSASRDGIDHYTLLYCQNRGVKSYRIDQEFDYKTGDIAFGDLGQKTLTSGSGDQSNMVFYIPRDVLDPMLPRHYHGNLNGLQLHRDESMCRLLASHLDLLGQTISTLESSAVPYIAQSLLNLLVAGVSGKSLAQDDVSKRFPLERIAQIKSFIHEQLANPKLDSALIMAEFGVSRSKLYE